MIKYLLTLFIVSYSLKISLAQTFSTLSSGCNNKVNAIVGDAGANNIIYAGGEFQNAGGNVVNRVAKWNGSAWSAMDNGMDSYVRTLTFFNNELYAGGDFIYAGGTVCWMVAKWNGSSWDSLNTGVRGSGVYSLAVYNSELYAGGFFDTTLNFNQGRGIVKWNGTSWVAINGVFASGVAGAAGFRVRAMKTFGGKLYVGGTFTTADGVTVNNIAKWDGTSWSAIGTGTNGDVNAFAVYNGDLYAGGNFTTANGVTVNHLAKISGNTFTAVGGGTNGVVNALAPYQNSLYVTGDFGTSGAVTTQNISRWDGTSWHNLTPSIPGVDGPGYCLTPFNGELFIGGFFAVAGTLLQANSIVKWNFPVGIEETPGTGNELQIFPNPSSGKIQLKLTGSIPEKFDLSINDISGRELFSQKIDNYMSNIQIDLPGLKKGMYFLKLISEKTTLSSRLIIE
ncbi:MAG: T9SS type A sorting domain-containing protein [Bacteroidia bacterium]